MAEKDHSEIQYQESLACSRNLNTIAWQIPTAFFAIVCTTLGIVFSNSINIAENKIKGIILLFGTLILFGLFIAYIKHRQANHMSTNTALLIEKDWDDEGSIKQHFQLYSEPFSIYVNEKERVKKEVMESWENRRPRTYFEKQMSWKINSTILGVIFISMFSLAIYYLLLPQNGDLENLQISILSYNIHTNIPQLIAFICFIISMVIFSFMDSEWIYSKIHPDQNPNPRIPPQQYPLSPPPVQYPPQPSQPQYPPQQQSQYPPQAPPQSPPQQPLQ